jgi:calcineurin-like phosphoesterase family protein
MIDLWNSQVNPEDTVYHLGDFSFYKSSQTIDVLSRLNGYKIFLKGNHDSDQYMKPYVSTKVINEYKMYDEIKIKGLHAVLFHFNIRAWHKQGYGSIHLFGHSHGNLKDNFGLSLDVGIDSAFNIYGKHKFFTEEDVVQYMQGRKLEIADHHAEC